MSAEKAGPLDRTRRGIGASADCQAQAQRLEFQHGGRWRGDRRGLEVSKFALESDGMTEEGATVYFLETLQNRLPPKTQEFYRAGSLGRLEVA